MLNVFIYLHVYKTLISNLSIFISENVLLVNTLIVYIITHSGEYTSSMMTSSSLLEPLKYNSHRLHCLTFH